jgi:hypothetical protein
MAFGENMNNRRLQGFCSFLSAFYFYGACAFAADDPHVAENAPKDCNASMTSQSISEIVEKLSPDALRTWPAAKKRFLDGLPERHSLFVTLLVSEPDGRSEYLFVAVDEIVEDQIRGRIWSDVKVVKNLSFRAPIEIPENAISDWLITKPDGSEDGNIVGKYVDTLEQCRNRAAH